jgi:hypothetical protein
MIVGWVALRLGLDLLFVTVIFVSFILFKSRRFGFFKNANWFKTRQRSPSKGISESDDLGRG